ncbi:hypothetical protein BKA93DRAFT_706566, partial [Sparassis latifolia]
CFSCGEAGHTLPQCPKRVCFKCGATGHQGRTCPNPPRSQQASCSRCGGRNH